MIHAVIHDYKIAGKSFKIYSQNVECHGFCKVVFHPDCCRIGDEKSLFIMVLVNVKHRPWTHVVILCNIIVLQTLEGRVAG